MQRRGQLARVVAISSFGLCAALLLVAGDRPAVAAEPATLELVQTIPLKGAAGRLDHLAIDTKHARLFIANLSNDSLEVHDIKAVVGQIGDEQPAVLRVDGQVVEPACRPFQGDGLHQLQGGGLGGQGGPNAGGEQ